MKLAPWLVALGCLTQAGGWAQGPPAAPSQEMVPRQVLLEQRAKDLALWLALGAAPMVQFEDEATLQRMVDQLGTFAGVVEVWILYRTEGRWHQVRGGRGREPRLSGTLLDPLKAGLLRAPGFMQDPAAAWLGALPAGICRVEDPTKAAWVVVVLDPAIPRLP